MKRIIIDGHDPKKLVINFSWYELNEVKKSALWNGFNFWVKPQSTEYLELSLPFDLLFRDVKETENSSIRLFAKKSNCKKVGRAI